MIKYSIVIPTWNHLHDCLIPCLTAIFKYTDLSNVEIIVIANGCTDGTEDYLDGLGPAVTYYSYPEPLGYTKSTNIGIEKAKGEYVILMNNDAILLQQPKNQWIEMLSEPFERDEKVGITGSLRGWSDPANSFFMIFFLVMIRRQLFDELGLLDEQFSPGGGEDTEFCIRLMDHGYKQVQVPSDTQLDYNPDTGLFVSTFPVFHQGEATVYDLPDWQQIFDKNSFRLAKMYNNQRWLKGYLHQGERGVFASGDDVWGKESGYYKWAAEHIYGSKVLELGCSSGYGSQFFKDIDNLEYTGIDYSEAIIEYATWQFGSDTVKFEHANIDEYQFGQYDTIIAFEVLEHLDKGKYYAQILKKHCKRLLIGVPYDEQPGEYTDAHKIHHLTPQDFIGFDCSIIHPDGTIDQSPKPHNRDSMLLYWDSDPTFQPSMFLDVDRSFVVAPSKIDISPGQVTCVVPTKNRYFSTLPLTLTAIANQTQPPNKLVIYDDSDEQLDLREDPTYKHVFGHLEQKGISYYWVWSGRQGQVVSHQQSLNDATTEFIWRVDDDNVPDPKVLYKLYHAINDDDDIGAVGGCVWFPDRWVAPKPWYAKSSFKSKLEFQTMQWYRHERSDPVPVDHLYSTFLYRVEAGRKGGGYPVHLSVVGHREETIFSHRIKRAGYRLLVVPSAVTWHYHAANGGIRSYSDGSLWRQDEEKYQQIIANEWEYNIPDGNILPLKTGIGDHYIVKKHIMGILEKYKHELVLAPAYPDVFADVPIDMISIPEAESLIGNLDKYNPYRWCIDNKFAGNMYDAIWSMYGHGYYRESLQPQAE